MARFRSTLPKKQKVIAPVQAIVLITSVVSIFILFYSHRQVYEAKDESRRISFSNSSSSAIKPILPAEQDFPFKWRPMDCHDFLKQTFEGKGPVEDPNHGQLFGRMTSPNETKHPFWINIHTKLFDPRRYEVWTEGYYYEKVLTGIFQDILEDAPANGRVLDVGGNIGWFTFLSGSMKHHVDVFEPNAVNLIRLCQSKRLNEWETATEADITSRAFKRSSINIRQYGVSSEETTRSMFFGNPGMGTFVNTREFVPSNGRLGQKEVKDLPLITLDTMATELNWFQIRPIISILKIDIEGSEALAVQGARKLLKSGMVRNILMESTGRFNNTENQMMLEQIINSGYKLHRVGGGSGPNLEPPVEMPTSDASAQARFLIENYMPKVRKQVNLWWKH